MRFRTARILVAFWLLWAGCVQAVTNCNQNTLTADQVASDYLEAYGHDCIVKGVDDHLKKWKIDSFDPKKPKPIDYVRMVPAWEDIAEELDEIAKSTTAGKMKDVYSKFTARARAAAGSLKSSLDSGVVSNISLYQQDAWEQVKMNLPEYKLGQYYSDIDVGAAMNDDCKVPTSSLCEATISQGEKLMLDWGLASTLAFNASAENINAVAIQVATKNKLWDQYLYDSKPMLPFDFWITDIIEQPKENSYLQGVPEPSVRQWFLLHPSFGVEYASAATDGQQLKPVLYLELFGLNYWDKKRRFINTPILNVLSGVSAIISYADRAGLKDHGMGLLLTFDNVYTIGITRYGSETGISLSLDLANLYRDKFKSSYLRNN